MSSSPMKNISFGDLLDAALLIPTVPPLSRGALRGRHERWVRDAVDALAAQDERGGSGRRSRVVLISRR